MKLLRLSVQLLGFALPCVQIHAGTWTKLANDAPGTVFNMLLLTDGTVIGSDPGSDIEVSTRTWYKLTPDSHGSYINGTWTTIAHMRDSRLYFSSAVLKDGRVFVTGGVNGSGSATCEIYDPLTDTWTPIAVPTSLLDPNTGGQGFFDSESILLPDGRVLTARGDLYDIETALLIYDPKGNTWIAGASMGAYVQSLNQTWVKLPDYSLIRADPIYAPPDHIDESEQYIPWPGSGFDRWVADARVPVDLYVHFSIALPGTPAFIGPGLLLPDGRAFFLGGNGKTAFYSPSGNSNSGQWIAGPDIPFGLVAATAPAAMMVNGKVLCAVGPALSAGGGAINHPTPASFFEFDPAGPSFTQVNGPTGLTDGVPTDKTTMLALPDGTVLYAHHNNQLYAYRPDGGPLSAWKPTISSVRWNSDGSLHLSGTQLNGLSQGASFGDGAQMDSNYPLVRLSDGAGNVFYARTHDWSSTGVMTSNQVVSTEFTLPAFLPAAPYSLVVVANGISSDPIAFNGPVWVDFTYGGFFQTGSYDFPYKTLAQGVAAVPVGGTIAFRKSGSSSETMRITKAMTLVAVGGPARIGGP
jgi:hypothetical protein